MSVVVGRSDARGVTGARSYHHSGAHVYKAALQTLATSTTVFTTVEFDTVRFDDLAPYAYFGAATYAFVAPRAGKYRLGAKLRFPANATGYRYADLFKNGTTALDECWVGGHASAPGALVLHTLVVLAKGDSVVVRALQNSGGDLDLAAAAEAVPQFTIEFVGA